MNKAVKYIGAISGAFLVGIALMLTTTKVVYPAISQLVGLSVAESTTLWNSVRDGAAGDNISNGVLDQVLMLWDGTNFDRARGDITNGLDVDVTRMSGTITPADDYANPTTANQVWALNGVFDGTAWDRWRGGVSPSQIGTLLNSRTVSTANTAIATTLTGAAGTRVHLYKVQARCAGGSSYITITDGGTTIYDTDGGTVSAGTTYTTFEWTTALTGTTAANMVVTLAACGVGNIGVMSVQADRY